MIEKEALATAVDTDKASSKMPSMQASSGPRADQPFPPVSLAGGPGGEGGAGGAQGSGQEDEETFERGAVKFQVYKTYFQVIHLNILFLCY